MFICTCDDNGSDIIEPEQFAEIYVEMVMTSIDSTTVDSTNVRKRILAEYDVSQQEFQNTMEYYYKKPMLWLDVFTEVNDKLEHRLRSEK